MRYVSTVAALAAGVAAAPSLFDQSQLIFNSPVGESHLSSLESSAALKEVLSGNWGNTVPKGTKWVKEHLADPRCWFPFTSGHCVALETVH